MSQLYIHTFQKTLLTDVIHFKLGTLQAVCSPVPPAQGSIIFGRIVGGLKLQYVAIATFSSFVMKGIRV